MELVMTGIVVAFIVAPVPATWATLYLWHFYSLDRSNWVLRAFAVGATIVNLSSVFFGFLAVRRIAGADVLDWTPPLSAAAALALEVVPIYFALEFRRRRAQRRRRATDGT